jgi:vitamin B12 transporter
MFKTKNNIGKTVAILSSLQNLLSLPEQKSHLTLMKKTLLIQLTLVLFATQSFSQLRMRDKSVWRQQSKPDTTSNKGRVAKEEVRSESEADTSSAKHLNEVIVTASRTEKKLDDIGRSVSYISKEEIKNSGANSVAEVLSQYEGIYIVGTQQTFGANQGLFIRGANSNQSVVMIDGVPISDPSTPNAAIDLSELSLSDIDHIEVVRGSHSTLYGSSAIGGVVNIITSGKQKEGLNINASGTGGSFGKETSLVTEKVGLNYTCKQGFYADMNLLNMNVNGIAGAIDTSTTKHPMFNKKSMNRFDYGGKIGYQDDKWNVHLGMNMINTHSDIDKGSFQPDNAYTLDFNRKLISYGATYKIDSSFSVSFNGGYSSMTRTAIDDSSIIDLLGNYNHSYYKGIYTGQTYTDEIQFQFRKKYYSIIFGGGNSDQFMNQQTYSYSQGYIYSSNLDSLHLVSRTNSAFGLFDLNGAEFSEKLKAFSISFGGRLNQTNTFGPSATYQINPMVKVSSTTSVYANLSTGYNAPSLYQLHAPDMNGAPVSNITLGNVNLRPEESKTMEFGVYQKLSENSWIRLGYFKTVVNNIIEYVYLWDKNTAIDSLNFNSYHGSTYLNLGTLTSEGIEMNIHSQLSKKLLLAANFSYVNGKEDFTSANIDTVKTQGNHVQLYSNGKFLTNNVTATGLTRRPVMANVSLTYYPVKKVFCKAVLRYVSARNDVYYDYSLGPYGALGTTSVAAYTLVDFIGGVKFDANTSALVRVENIFNTSYSEIQGYASRGRGIYFTVNYTF